MNFNVGLTNFVVIYWTIISALKNVLLKLKLDERGNKKEKEKEMEKEGEVCGL